MIQKPIRRGFSFFSFTDNKSLLERCHLIADAGYHGVELVVREKGVLRLDSSTEELNALKGSIGAMGLEIPSLGVEQFWQHNLVSLNTKERELALQSVLKSVEIAAELGASTLLLIPGWVGSTFNSTAERVPYDKAYALLEAQLKHIAPVAESLGVVVALENVWNKFLLSPLEVRSLLDTINSPYVQIYFDVGNILSFGYPEDWIRILQHRIAQIHVCDYRVDQAGLGGFVELFSGDLDIPSLVGALQEITYNGYYMVEVFPANPQYPEQSIITYQSHLDLFEKLLKETL